ncbi:MAG: hypothetical protein J1E64_08185 [Acetatifactor sp.]|nr:hypothetical protein [Acetatifactor sp.]
MSYKELAKNLIDQIPDSKMYYIVAYLQGAAIPEEIPNMETLEALEEVEEMIRTGSGQHFQGTAEDFTDMLLSEA